VRKFGSQKQAFHNSKSAEIRLVKCILELTTLDASSLGVPSSVFFNFEP